MGFRMVKISLISGDPLKAKVRVKPPKIEEHFYSSLHSKPTQEQWVVLCRCIGCCNVLSAAIPNSEGSHSVRLFMFHFYNLFIYFIHSPTHAIEISNLYKYS